MNVGLLLLAHLLVGQPSESASCGLVLEVTPLQQSVRPGQPPAATAILTNRGERSLTLVMPGDGSERGRRTPFVLWRFEPPTQLDIIGCGSITGLEQGEVFVLAPGDSRVLGSVRAAQFLRAGSYKATVAYENNPDAPFHGMPTKPHDEVELARVRASDRCIVVAAEIQVVSEGTPVWEPW